MYPRERSLVKRLEDKPFTLIGVNSDPDRVYIEQRTRDEGITWRSFWNGPKGPMGPIAARWNVLRWPTTYVLDHRGVIRFKDVRGEDLDAAVDRLLREMDAGASPREKRG